MHHFPYTLPEHHLALDGPTTFSHCRLRKPNAYAVGFLSGESTQMLVASRLRYNTGARKHLNMDVFKELDITEIKCNSIS